MNEDMAGYVKTSEFQEIRFPLSRGNLLEIRLFRKCTQVEFDVIRKLLTLAETAFVDDAEAEANMPDSGVDILYAIESVSEGARACKK